MTHSSKRKKYQFCIFEQNEETRNSAATKAVLDCNSVFSEAGYTDYTVTFNNNSRRGAAFYLAAFREIVKLLLGVKRGSLIGVQYPILNKVFKYFIFMGRAKGIRFFAVIHDIESLRLGAKDAGAVKTEACNFNHYDALIVHNDSMKQWLRDQGVTIPLVSLKVFDYLAPERTAPAKAPHIPSRIVYAGNLSKSTFVYKLPQNGRWKFNLYGPNYLEGKSSGENVVWKGVYPPDEIAQRLEGDFGLIWDGTETDRCDEIMGNYLRYNNPHKFSLYLAAGLPVIAPAGSAIGKLISEHQIGILVSSLAELESLSVSQEQYAEFAANCRALGTRVRSGHFLKEALQQIESIL